MEESLNSRQRKSSQDIETAMELSVAEGTSYLNGDAPRLNQSTPQTDFA